MKSCKTDKGRYKYSIYRQSNEICLETYLEEKETGQIFVGSYNEKVQKNTRSDIKIQNIGNI